MQKIMDYINDEVAEPLSDDDVLALVKGKANVIRNMDLDKYQSIDEMLYPYDACFLLYESKPHYGHWCCLTKHGNELEFFDSYGSSSKQGSGFPDSQLNYIDEDFLLASGQNNRYLTELLLKCDYDMSYNDHPFQKSGSKIATCGRWASIRILLKDLKLADFKNLLLGPDSDKLAAILTSP